MRYLALATDYDGTLAHGGRVDERTLAALDRFATAGRKLILVTGRRLDDLRHVFPYLDRFHRVVAENGALLHDPATRATRILAPPPHASFVEELRRRGVTPLAVGESIVATWEPQEVVVLDAIRDLGLELQVIFNKGAVMVLAPGVNKASGLRTALAELALSAHNVVAIGDAENDHALLAMAELSVAVSNAVPMLREAADVTTRGDHGAGVVELIDSLLGGDLSRMTAGVRRRSFVLGTRANGESVQVPASGFNLLVAGTSGSGKSTLSTSVLEQLIALSYQCCIVDPEGDYGELDDVFTFGSAERAPGVDEVVTALEKPEASIVVNLLGVPLADRPHVFTTLLSRLHELRTRTGRPHWILVDEAHHMLPADWQPATAMVSDALNSMICVTVHPESLAPDLLRRTDVIATLGDAPDAALRSYARAAGIPSPRPATAVPGAAGEALVWLRKTQEAPFVVRVQQPSAERTRHKRKYAQGELGPDRSFYFRGPDQKLNLRAYNLLVFLQIADGVDDDTWLHHLRRGDYSRWFAECIKDAELASAAASIESDGAEVGADESRERMRSLIEENYTLPAMPASLAQ